MGEVGRVKEIRGDKVVVSMERREACAKCKACIAGMDTKEMVIEARNECNAEIGQWVEVSLDNQNFLKAVLIMYGIPFVALMCGFILGANIAPTVGLQAYRDLFAFGLGVFFTVLVYIWIKSKESHWKSKQYEPSAIQIFQQKPVDQ